MSTNLFAYGVDASIMRAGIVRPFHLTEPLSVTPCSGGVSSLAGSGPVPERGRAIAAYHLEPMRKPTVCSGSALSLALSRRVASSPSSNDVPPLDPSPSRQPRR